MSRARSRVNRGLIALLVVVLALGLAFYLHNLTKTKAAETSAKSQTALSSEAPIAAAPRAAVPTAPPAPAHVEPAALVTVTPTTAPSATPSISSSTSLDTRETPNPTASPSVSITKSAPSSVSVERHTLQALPAGATPDQLLKDGKSKFDAGQLLSARQSLEAALASGKLSPADVATTKSMLSQINATIVFSSQRFADDPFGGTHAVVSGERLARIASESDITVGLLKRINNITDERKLRAGSSIKIIKGPFHAVVDKSDFTIDLYLGNPPGKENAMYVTTYKVGLGKDDSTPTGVWQVEPGKKTMHPTYYSPRGEGVIESSDPKNPLGTRWIGLVGIDGQAIGKTSYGIHGTIEPDSIGKQESMGCIRLHNEDVELVFDLLIEAKSTVTVRE